MTEWQKAIIRYLVSERYSIAILGLVERGPEWVANVAVHIRPDSGGWPVMIDGRTGEISVIKTCSVIDGFGGGPGESTLSPRGRIDPETMNFVMLDGSVWTPHQVSLGGPFGSWRGNHDREAIRAAQEFYCVAVPGISRPAATCVSSFRELCAGPSGECVLANCGPVRVLCPTNS